MELYLIGLAGALLGSFLNVVIYRLPRNESVVFPRSRCPQCGHAIRFWENIPVVSYLLLRGKCSSCRRPIPLYYVLVEVLTPGALMVLYWQYGFTPDFFKNALLVLFLIPITFIDLHHRLILDKLTYPGIVVGLLLSIWQNPQQFYQPFLGLLAGGGLLWLISLLGQSIYKQESMGGGDIKMGAMIGSFMNAGHILLALFLSFFIASVFVLIGLGTGKLQRKSMVPFGPFIALGAVITMNFKSELIRLYVDLILN